MSEYLQKLLESAAITTFIGFLGKSFYDLLIEQRKAKLAYINNQIEKLYGPLYILDNAGTTAYDTFLKKINRVEDPNLEKPLSEDERKEWVLWVEDIFIPINLEMEKVIKLNAHFFIEHEMPKPVLDFISHVTVYKTVLKKWQTNNFEELFSLIDYPKDLSAYLKDAYNVLKSKQMNYLKKLKIEFTDNPLPNAINMKRLLLFFLLILAIECHTQNIKGQVVKIADGDTFTLLTDEKSANPYPTVWD